LAFALWLRRRAPSRVLLNSHDRRLRSVRAQWLDAMAACPPAYCSNPYQAYPITGRDKCEVLPLSALTMTATLSSSSPLVLDVTRMLNHQSTLQLLVQPPDSGQGPVDVTVSARLNFSAW
jgi:hypothetical protein